MSPVISGILGSLIAATICAWWLNNHPFNVSKQQQKHLVKKYKRNIYLANFLILAPLVVAIALFKSGVIPNNDWRFGLLFLGSAFGLPLWSLFIPPRKQRGSFNEALLAISVKQKTPKGLMLFLLVLGNILATIGLANVLA